MPPPPLGTQPVGVFFGTLLIDPGTTALVLMGHGFGAGLRLRQPRDDRKDENGGGLRLPTNRDGNGNDKSKKRLLMNVVDKEEAG